MKRNTLIITSIALLVSIAAVSAFAHGPGWGRSRGYGHMTGSDGWGPGWHHRGGHGHGQEGNYGKTEDIRQNLYAKELELRSELAKENPDTSKASKLQSDISKLQSNLDQERLNCEIKARESAPSYNRGPGGYGPMMGYSPRGGGYCM